MGSVERTTFASTRRAVALEGRVRLVRVVDQARHHHRRCAVLEQVGALRGPPLLHVVVLEQVIDGPGQAVALGLTGYDHYIELEQLLDQSAVLALQQLAVRLPA